MDTNNGGSIELMTELEVAKVLRVSPRTVWEFRNTGRLPGVKLGSRTIRYDAVDVRAFLRANRTEELAEFSNN
jgi:excisionase family DNA binding protein